MQAEWVRKKMCDVVVGPQKDVWRCSLSVSAGGVLYVNLEVCLVSLILAVAELLKPFMIWSGKMLR